MIECAPQKTEAHLKAYTYIATYKNIIDYIPKYYV